jgi:hypothetical protein
MVHLSHFTHQYLNEYLLHRNSMPLFAVLAIFLSVSALFAPLSILQASYELPPNDYHKPFLATHPK